MKRNTQANDGKILRYSLRKYKVGLASVTIGLKHTGRTS